mgnify:CR=1 FL=1
MEIFRRLGAFLLDILQTVVLALAIFLFVYLFLLQPHKIKGDSMLPNFQDGEFLLTEKVSYRFSQPKRGDIVVFAAPPNENEDFIKRIIALAGDRIVVKEGRIYINDFPLLESYLSENIATEGSKFLENGEEYLVKPDEYILLGDNRPRSSDSRTWGPVKRDKIVGKVWIVYWPIPKAGLVREVIYAGF